MRRFRLIVLAAIMLALCGTAWGSVPITGVTFPDATFMQYVLDNIDANNNSTLDDSEIAATTEINVSGSAIVSLKGIEYFTSLLTLNCSNNQLTTLDVSRNTSLQVLDCSQNQLTTLDVSKNTSLQVLDCFDNKALVSLNLSNNKALKGLACDFTISRTGDTCEFNFANLKSAYNLGGYFDALHDDDLVQVTYLVELGSYHLEHYRVSNLRLSSNPNVLRFTVNSGLLFQSIEIWGELDSYSLSVHPASVTPGGSAGTKPSITTSELPPATVGEEYSVQLSASGLSPITWTASGLPDGLTLSSTGLLSGTPTKKGRKTITFTAKNSAGSGKKKLSLTVSEFPELPSITTESLKPAVVGKKYSETLKGTGTAPLTWSIDGTLPAGITFDAKKGKFSGTPTADASETITVTLSNAYGADSKVFTLDAGGILPTISTSKLKDGTWNKHYEAQIKTKGTEPITLTLEGDLPEGLTFNAAAGTITGTPTEACYDRPITITAWNMSGSVEKTYYLTIKAVAPKITTKSLPKAAIYTDYSVNLEATGTPNIVWTAEKLPEWLTLRGREV